MDGITKPDLLESDVMRIKKSKAVALDTETAGLNPHRDPLYLIQVCDQDGVIDFVKTKDWQAAHNLHRILTDSAIAKVFHFAIMDCAFILKNLGVLPQNLYCTKIASKITRTYAPAHTLAVLVEEMMGVTLNKKQQSTFWGREPLTTEQLEYATNDVKYLLEIKARLEDILVQKEMLPTGISYIELNQKCQAFIPFLVHLWLNGWDFAKEDQASIFGR